MVIIEYALVYSKHNTKNITKTKNHYNSLRLHTVTTQHYCFDYACGTRSHSSILAIIKPMQAILLNISGINSVDRGTSSIYDTHAVAVGDHVTFGIFSLFLIDETMSNSNFVSDIYK